MLPDTHFIREKSFLYPLQSHPGYWFHVGRSDDRQALFGLIGCKMYAFLFSELGDLIETQSWPLPLTSDASNGPVEFAKVHKVVEAEVDNYRETTKLIDQPINVKRFSVPDLNVGIEDLPSELRAFSMNPALVESAERPSLQEALSGWIEEALFVLRWDQDFYVDAEGIVTSS